MNDFQYLNKNLTSSFRKDYTQSTFSNKKLSYKIYNNCFILPNKDGKSIYGGIVDNTGQFVNNSGLHEGLGQKYDFNKECVSSIFDTPIIYIGFIVPIWGHVITDGLAKIWFLFSEDGQKLIKSNRSKIAYVTLRNEPLPGYIVDLFRYAGLNIDDCIHVQFLSYCSNLIVPDNSFFIQNKKRLWTIEYKKTISTIIHNSQKGGCKAHIYEKIYLTRTHLQNRADYGEAEIEKVFGEDGYHIIAPEEHSVSKQIFMFQNCKKLATTEGSISHNAIFLKDNATIVLIKKANFWNSYQIAINEVNNLNVIWIDSHRSTLVNTQEPWRGPFYVFPSKKLLDYLNKKRFSIPVFMKLSYWYYITKSLYFPCKAVLIKKIYRFIKCKSK